MFLIGLLLVSLIAVASVETQTVLVPVKINEVRKGKN